MTIKRETIYLVDGSSYIYRAYHAIKNLSNSNGLPTNAIFGFTKMILKLINEKSPSYLAIALDMKGPTFRHRIYEDYKATRPPMPEDLVIQLPYIRKVIEGLNIKILEKEGYEADDIIGTFARIGDENKFDVIMVTGDKDFRQLISPGISMYDTMKDALIDYESLKSEYGLEPAQFIDIMGLSGDISDNIPGVLGVGEKTALNLIKEYGTLEKVFENIHEIKRKKLKENLEKSRENAFLSKKLVTIDRFVPFKEGIDVLKASTPKKEELADLFHELEFSDLWRQFSIREEKDNRNYRLCMNKDDLVSILENIKQKGFVCLDTETTSLDPHNAELVGLSMAFKKNHAHYVPLGHIYLGAPDQMEPKKVLEILRSVLEDENISKIGQNIKYDAIVLKRYGIEMKGINFDTMIASYVIDPGLRQHNLDYLAQKHLNYKMISYHDVVGKGRSEVNFSQVDIERAKEYSCEDADITLRLQTVLGSRLKDDQNEELFYNLEMKLLPILMDMEISGIRIDTGLFKAMSEEFSIQLRSIQKEIYREAGMEFNINSPQQLGFVIFEKLQLPVQKKTAKTKAYSTNVNALKKLAAHGFALPRLVLQFRTISKLKSTYLDGLIKTINPSTGRIHTSFNQTVTATGRLSSSNPNLQNIPIRSDEGRKIRKGFIPEQGHMLLSADYSQVELRIFAHYSKDPALIDAFSMEQDIHSRTASEILGVPLKDVTPEMRRVAKAINFGIIYGMGHVKLADELEIDRVTAKNYIDSYYKRYKGVSDFRDEMVGKARKEGFVTTLLNRRRYLPEINAEDMRTRGEAERMAVNTPIQGSAADLIKMAMIRIHDRLSMDDFRTKMLLQVHDELVFEVPEDELDKAAEMVKKEMENAYSLDVPLKVDVSCGKNWDEAH